MAIRNLVIVGVGLIGGSLAAAARAKGLAEHIIGVEPNSQSASYALAQGLVDEIVEEVSSDADLCALCVPSDRIAEWALKLADYAATVIDVGSVKGPIVEAVQAAPATVTNFVPCHPISGSEKSGPRAADAQLFDGCAVVLTPLPDGDAQKQTQVQAFWQQLGTQVYVMSPADHDQALAVTSHLPHLLAFAFMQQITEVHAPLTGGGFRDFTRIAGADPNLWWRILRLNSRSVIDSAEKFVCDLKQIVEAIERNDSTQGLAQLRHAAEKKAADKKI